MSEPRKVVLAYSGGLDTSVMLRWLEQQYGCEVITFTADIGQGDDFEAVRDKARQLGLKQIHIENLQGEFVADYVYPMLRANPLYEGEYMLGTSIARPLIARHLVRVAKDCGADAIAHGATGKGNDQVRFELAIQALAPELRIIAPWREWSFTSRQSLLDYAAEQNIPIERKQDGGAPYSTDANLLHISYEGEELEDPWAAPALDMWRWTTDPSQAPDTPEVLTLGYRAGDITAIDGEALEPAAVLDRLNQAGARHGIGRIDIVENRYIGMKSRGCYETPGGTLMLKAHRAIESLTLDREVAHLKDELMPRYASLVYNGYWFSPERQLLQQLIDASQARVNGEVRLSLYKGAVQVIGRRAPNDSLFDRDSATFEDDAGRYRQADAEGFIRLNALRLRLAGRRGDLD